MLRPGDEVEYYRILSSLGEGGMGVVYAAEHKTLRKRVANLDAHRDAIRDALDLLFSGI